MMSNMAKNNTNSTLVKHTGNIAVGACVLLRPVIDDNKQDDCVPMETVLATSEEKGEIKDIKYPESYVTNDALLLDNVTFIVLIVIITLTFGTNSMLL